MDADTAVEITRGEKQEFTEAERRHPLFFEGYGVLTKGKYVTRHGEDYPLLNTPFLDMKENMVPHRGPRKAPVQAVPVTESAPVKPEVNEPKSENVTEETAPAQDPKDDEATFKEDTINAVVDAIKMMDPAKDFTIGGKPTTTKLSELLVFNVSGPLRDIAWAKLQKEKT